MSPTTVTRSVDLLLVEDSAPEARLVESLLRDTELSVHWRDTLRDALEALEERHFDLVLLDLNLPDSRGLDTLRRVRRAARGAAIVVTTVLDDQELAISAVGEGAQDYLLKGTTDGRLLVQSLRYALERQRLFQSLRASQVDAESRSAELSNQFRAMQSALGHITDALDRERAAAKEREEVDRQKRELLSLFAHDLRSPIGVIHGFVDILLAQWDSVSDEKARGYLRTIQKNAVNVNRLILDVLEIARLESGKMTCASAPFDLHAVLESVVEQANASVGAERVTLERASDAKTFAFGDAHRHWQVAMNLVGNALKFSPPGTPVIVAHSVQGAMHEVRVRDRGPGIPRDQVARLFQKFSRLPRHTESGQDPVSGTGLGLFIARSIVEAQGGTIEVEGAPGEGAVFKYTVPVAQGGAS